MDTGLRCQISVKPLAGCGPSEERKRTLPEMEFPARNDRHATQQKKKKQRGKLVDFKDLHARNNARHDYRINMIHITKYALVNSVNPEILSLKLCESTQKSGKAIDGLPFKWAIK
jgi:hypothetical protein